ncbi:3-beta hydroxysteroid dehydrogenase/isomerase family-domain-containing protein [Mycena pura]|uniref:3-beta hydroxysteroid dehydrogenase/isomerase family-domain-containing protein n=1 Tax=Mycena pura TaxID=153505 RepID=A0AAD6V248_9AGAR|nr:3-beta hydroxysteroid dehydrogenase/isomerase family-domain-containing protein [Mycena pura]
MCSPSQGKNMHSALVIGGAGFLGSHVVEQLVNHGEYVVSVFDIQEPNDESRVSGVTYVQGSVVDATSIANVIKELQPLIVLHTASPVHGLPPKIYYEVNETGTQNVISACRAAGVKKLIYTSSTGVVWTGAEFNGVSEDQINFPAKGYDAYHHTKGLGERLILAAEGHDGMQTVIIRPCGMTGERDKQLIWRLAEVYDKKQHRVQIGDNTNLVDYAYAGNVAHAHVLACEKLIADPDLVSGQTFFITNGEPLPQNENTASTSGISVSLSQSHQGSRDKNVCGTFNSASTSTSTPLLLPVYTPQFNRFGWDRCRSNRTRQTFFITNGEPLPQWDFSRMIWKELGDDGNGRVTVIPRFVGLIMASLAEIFCRITGSSTQFTKFSVRYLTGTQWYNIDKADVLGYKPNVSLEEGIKRTVKVCF